MDFPSQISNFLSPPSPNFSSYLLPIPKISFLLIFLPSPNLSGYKSFSLTLIHATTIIDLLTIHHYDPARASSHCLLNYKGSTSSKSHSIPLLEAMAACRLHGIEPTSATATTTSSFGVVDYAAALPSMYEILKKFMYFSYAISSSDSLFTSSTVTPSPLFTTAGAGGGSIVSNFGAANGRGKEGMGLHG